MSVTEGPWEKRRSFQEFQPFTPAKWEGVKAPAHDWIVDGCFLRGTVAMVSGDGGLGKSLLMQQLITASAMGRPWLGLKTQRCKSLAIFCEDDMDELHRRQTDICRHYDCAMGDLGENVLMESRSGRESVLMNFGKWGDGGKSTPLLEQVHHAARQHGAQIIILDTLADVFSGNEVDRNQPRTFIRALRRIALERQGVVILTQHPSLAGMNNGTGMSGSTGWNNSVRSRLYLTSPKGQENGPNRVLKTMKSNSGPKGGKIELTWQRGVFVTATPAPAAKPWSEPEPEW